MEDQKMDEVMSNEEFEAEALGLMRHCIESVMPEGNPPGGDTGLLVASVIMQRLIFAELRDIFNMLRAVTEMFGGVTAVGALDADVLEDILKAMTEEEEGSDG